MNDQAAKLRNIVSGNDRTAKTISIVSGKGGVGKSNTAVNFALELMKRDKKVLIFDLDIGMGNIDILIGNDSKYSIANLFTDFLPIRDMIELGPHNLSYVAGGSSLNELIQLDDKNLQYFFDQFEDIASEFDYILFDLGAGASDASMSFILSSDESIIITTPEPTAITDAYSMIKHIVHYKESLPISLILNRCRTTREGKVSIDKFTEVVQRFLIKDIKTLGMLPEDRFVSTAVIKQTPYTILNENAAVSIAMSEIVENYLKEEGSRTINEIKTSTFIQRLKRFLSK